MFFKNPLERSDKRVPQPSLESIKEDARKDAMVLNRRQVLFGATALAAATLVPKSEAQADGGPESIPVSSREAKESNVERIHAFMEKLRLNRDVIEGSEVPKQDKMDVLRGVPPTDFESLQGTEFDPEAFFRFNQSWPSIQIRKEYGKELQQIRRAHEENPIGVAEIVQYGNGFEITKQDGTSLVFTNTHVAENSLQCTILGPDTDIAACSVDNFGYESKGESRSKLYWDESKRTEDLYGQLVHIPSIHEQRGKNTPDNTDITSGILIKIKDTFFVEGTNETPFFRRELESNMEWLFMKEGIEKEGDSFNTELNQMHAKEYAQNRIRILKHSYMCIVPSRETNGDGEANMYDTQGVSGSPVFTDADVKAGRRVPSGIVWGTGTVRDEALGISYTVLFIHGPEVLGEMMDAMGVDGEVAQVSLEDFKEVTKKVQEAINVWLRKNNRSNRLVDTDGVYGRDTAGAIYAFQMKVFGSNTPESPYTPGLVDARTWQALMPQEPFIDIVPFLEGQ